MTIMSTISKFLLINTALVNLVFPNSVVALSMATEVAVVGVKAELATPDITFEPDNGGECKKGPDECAAGGSY